MSEKEESLIYCVVGAVAHHAFVLWFEASGGGCAFQLLNAV